MERFVGEKQVKYHILLVILLLVAAVCAPRLFLAMRSFLSKSQVSTTPSGLMLGVDLCDKAALKKLLQSKGSFALVANRLSLTSSGLHTIDHLVCQGFVPQYCLSTHEFHFSKADASYLYQASGTAVPCINLYVENALNTEPLQAVDTIIFDMSDRGLVQDAYQKMVLDVMTYAHSNQKKLIILDRPTQVSSSIEGTLKRIASDAYTIQLPIAHGLTLGELATFYNHQLFHNEIDMHINQMKHFTRDVTDFTGNDATYIKMVLKPFEAIAPFDITPPTDACHQCILLADSLSFDRHNWFDLRAQLKKYGIDARMYRYYNELKKEYMSGLQLFAMPGQTKKPLQTTVFLLQFFKQKGLGFHLNEQFDTVVGNHKIRNYIEGKVTKDVFTNETNAELSTYFQNVYPAFLYQPVPIVLTL